jgi:hypothetical protein
VSARNTLHSHTHDGKGHRFGQKIVQNDDKCVGELKCLAIRGNVDHGSRSKAAHAHTSAHHDLDRSCESIEMPAEYHRDTNLAAALVCGISKLGVATGLGAQNALQSPCTGKERRAGKHSDERMEDNIKKD